MTLKNFCMLGVASMFDKRFKANKGLSDSDILMKLADDFREMAIRFRLDELKERSYENGKA